MKMFLLIAGDNYYPCSGTGDWIGTFETKSDAEDEVVKTDKTYAPYQIRGGEYDWYEIVNFNDWANR